MDKKEQREIADRDYCKKILGDKIVGKLDLIKAHTEANYRLFKEIFNEMDDEERFAALVIGHINATCKMFGLDPLFIDMDEFNNLELGEDDE